MSTKLLHSLTDKEKDMQKQLGCMNGIFQLFDRQYFFTGRRANNQNEKKLAPGQDTKHGMEKSGTMNKTPIGKEKLMAPVEPSRTSSSSSCSSSTFSSADWDKKAPSELSSIWKSSFPKTTSPTLPIRQPSSSPNLLPQSLDIRDIVKDSMKREAQGLSVKTKAEAKGGVQTIKHIDSPRPLQQQKYVNTKITRNDGSLGTVGKYPDAPCNGKHGSRTMTSRDAPRYSYDERISQDKLKSTTKLKDLPRLSLDSRERPLLSSASQSRSDYLSREINAKTAISRQILCLNQEPGSNKRPSTIVARLMGLEPTPDFVPIVDSQSLQKADSDAFSRSSRICDESKKNQVTGSPTIPHIRGSKNDYLLSESTSNSKFSPEPDPWRQTDKNRFSHKQTLKIQEDLKKYPQSSLSVYGEIQKRLTTLEFKKSGKDLRALKQILEAMDNTRGRVDNKKEEHAPYTESQTGIQSPSSSFDRTSIEQRQCNSPTLPIIKGSRSPKRHGSQIVVMKPTKQTERPANQPDSKPVIREICSVNNSNNTMDMVDRRRDKDITPKRNHLRDASSWPKPPHEIKTKRSLQNPKVTPTMREENQAGYAKNLGQRLQKKQEIDQLTCLTTQSSELGRSRKQSIMHPVESGSPTRKFRLKTANMQQDNGKSNWSRNEPRNLSHQVDKVSRQSDNVISQDSNIEAEVRGKSHTKQITGSFQLKELTKEDLTTRYAEDMLIAELAAVTLEQPSPVSVLDVTIYDEDFLSPVKKRLSAFQDTDGNEAEWSALCIDQLQRNRRSSCSSRFDQGSLDIDHLVHKLRPENSTQVEANQNRTESVCDDNKFEHRYISEILVAAGLLMDRGSSLTEIQLHPSELPLNTKLFHILEKVRGYFNPIEENLGKSAQSKFGEAIHRKLLFDFVNEILAQKSALAGSVESWVNRNKPAGSCMRADELHKELCSKIYQHQPAPYSSTMSSFDMINESENLAAYTYEPSGIVLDIERMIFKDLIGEVVFCGATGPQLQSGTCRRKLFPK